MMKHEPIFIMDEGDRTIGRIYSRREALKLIVGAGGALLLAACGPLGEDDDTSSEAAAGCVVRPELAEGPIFVDGQMNRADVRSDPATGAISAGALLNLTFNVSRLQDNSCDPLANAQIDIWHCDAAGIYSDTDQLGFDTVGQKFLRGHQFTDENGQVTFQTIYPGWYVGRAVHIHFKIRTEDGYDFTSQLFFDDDFTDQVFSREPYAQRGAPALRNRDDGIFNENGDQLLLQVQEDGDGYTTSFDITLDIS